MDKYDVSMVLASIRTERLTEFYASLLASIQPYTTELIVVSPYNLPDELNGLSNVKLIKDYGCPSRCVQIGALLAEGQFVTWNSDDAILFPYALGKCVDLLRSKTKKDVINIRYSEGVGRSGQEPPDNYWVSSTHPDQRLPNINPAWFNAGVGMYYTDYFYEMGGLDCRFEHANMNAHDLANRVQIDGGHIYMSPSLVMACDQEPGNSGSHKPVEEAGWENDRPLFAELWSNGPRDIRISYDSWKAAETVWSRRFKSK